MEARRRIEPDRRQRALAWFAFAGGAVAWSLHFLLGYLYAESACAAGAGEGAIEPLVIVATALLGVTAAAAALAGLRTWRGASAGRIRDPRRRFAFMGLTGLVAGVLFGFAIVLEGVQVAFLSCAPS